MKKLISISVLFAMMLGLCACGSQPAQDMTSAESGQIDATATEADIAHLEELYAGRTAYHGELHDHSDSGGRSDGKQTLTIWKSMMMGLEIDFATIVDHKQVRHMYLDEWDNTMFIGGTEAATWIQNPMGYITDEQNSIHYNMIFATPEPLLEIFEEFPEFPYTGGDPLEAEFPRYPHFTRERLAELAEAVKAKGGFFSHVHPKHNGMMNSDNPLDYWFADETGLEVINTYRSDRNGPNTQNNYKLWRDLLTMGKRVWATAGNDEHNMPSDKGLSTIYATEKNAQALVDSLRVGDFAAGPVGVRMCIGDNLMGSTADSFAGKRVVISVGDFHKSVADEKHVYRIDVYGNEDVIFSQEFSCTETVYFAFDAGDCRFYRAEIFDVTLNSRIGLGNPIWSAEKLPQ